MSFFKRNRENSPLNSVVKLPTPVDTLTHVRGVGGHQALLAGPPRRVKVELWAWQKGDTITVKLNGERVGEIDYSPALHHVLLAMRIDGRPPVLVDGEVRRGDVVERYLAVALPDVAALKLLAPESSMPAESSTPAESSINVHKTTQYQEALHGLYKPGVRRREAKVTFGTHVGGKYDGLPEGVITLNDQVIGELSAGSDGKWAIILEDQNAGIAGRLLVRIWPGHGGHADGESPYYVEALYKRQAPPT